MTIIGKKLIKKIIISIYLLDIIFGKKNDKSKYEEESKYLKLCHSHKLIKPIPKERNDHPKISVFIPVYNGAEYIVTAIRSIQNQNFEDYEILIIDDKSKDNSLEIIYKEAEKDCRIRILKNKKNYGTLYTKSKGIKNSKGKYFLLLDQDDCFSHPDAFSTLFDTAEKNNADIVHFNIFSSGLQELIIEERIKPTKLNQLIIKEDLREFIFLNLCYIWFWDKMYVTNNLKESLDLFTSKRYKTHLIAHEDIILNGLAASKSKSYYGIDKNYYWHNNQNEKAVTHNNHFRDNNFVLKYFSDFCEGFRLIYEYEKNFHGAYITNGYTNNLVTYSEYILHYGLEKREDFLNKCKILCDFILTINPYSIEKEHLNELDRMKKSICFPEIYEKYKHVQTEL